MKSKISAPRKIRLINYLASQSNLLLNLGQLILLLILIIWQWQLILSGRRLAAEQNHSLSPPSLKATHLQSKIKQAAKINPNRQFEEDLLYDYLSGELPFEELKAKPVAKAKNKQLPTQPATKRKLTNKELQALQFSPEQEQKWLKQIHVQLGAFHNYYNALTIHQKISQEFADLLAKKVFFINSKAWDKGTLYRLKLVGFASEYETRNFCQKLRRKEYNCFIVFP